MIRKSGQRLSIATTQKCVCAEIMRKQYAKARLRFDLTQSRFSFGFDVRMGEERREGSERQIRSARTPAQFE
jgi:chromosome condensin MukBEF MukE localization factor